MLACCTLHNYILSGGHDEFIPSEEDWIPQRVSQTTAREQREEAHEWAARRDQIANEMWANKYLYCHVLMVNFVSLLNGHFLMYLFYLLLLNYV